MEAYVMQKIMGLDYGDARTGVAISDLLCSIVGTTAGGEGLGGDQPGDGGGAYRLLGE